MAYGTIINEDMSLIETEKVNSEEVSDNGIQERKS